MTEIIKSNGGHIIVVDGKPYAAIPSLEGATDRFEKIEDGAQKWYRHTDVPTDHMRMEMILFGASTVTMVPSVSYNGNGWGDVPEYVGDRAEDGSPWRTTPATWAIGNVPTERTVTLEFELESEIDVNDAILALEDADVAEIKIIVKK